MFLLIFQSHENGSCITHDGRKVVALMENRTGNFVNTLVYFFIAHMQQKLQNAV